MTNIPKTIHFIAIDRSKPEKQHTACGREMALSKYTTGDRHGVTCRSCKKLLDSICRQFIEDDIMDKNGNWRIDAKNRS